MAKKYFVLDTNVLLHNAAALTSFADNVVVIPFTVIEELDKFKKGNDDTARHARQVIRTLDRLRLKGKIFEGVPIKETGGTLKIAMDIEMENHPLLREDKPDNRIISVAMRLAAQGKATTFVSKDINARIKSDALGLRTVDFEKQKVDFEHIYTGYRELEVEASAVDAFGAEKGMKPPSDDLIPNEFIVLKAGEDKTDVGRFDARKKRVVPLKYGRHTVQGVKARNLQQEMAIELLMLDSVKLVTLLGIAGTGKTLLAVACGLHNVVKEKDFEKLLISRPIMPMGRDIGYLPGTKEEKLAHWMQPIFDNLAYILRVHKGDKSGNLDKRIKELTDSRLIEMEALTYIRGRSIPDQFIIVDEAQNLTPHEIKTVISRIGEDSKLVLTGDPYQIDNPYLDSSSNGLSYSAERMKGLDMVGHVMLKRSERSRLASVAAQRL
ncbi:MAG: PhoH family protein, partial [Planctomycetia bacterium]|nr:PhoH family protein [Planctomycetia bacterium]